MMSACYRASSAQLVELVPQEIIWEIIWEIVFRGGEPTSRRRIPSEGVGAAGGSVAIRRASALWCSPLRTERGCAEVWRSDRRLATTCGHRAAMIADERERSWDRFPPSCRRRPRRRQCLLLLELAHDLHGALANGTGVVLLTVEQRPPLRDQRTQLVRLLANAEPTRRLHHCEVFECSWRR